MTRALSFALAFALMVLVAMSFGEGAPEGDSYFPRELVGVWRTTNPDYAGKTLELESDSVTFGVSPERRDKHLVLQVLEDKGADGSRLFSVATLFGSDEDFMSLRFFADQDIIVFGQQRDVIWKRSSEIEREVKERARRKRQVEEDRRRREEMLREQAEALQEETEAQLKGEHEALNARVVDGDFF